MTSEIIIDLIGEAKRCQCNGRTDKCHPETGICIDCGSNTAGTHCDLCASGFYGDPMNGEVCRSCQCPSESKNFANTCAKNDDGSFMCQCRAGYTGPKCDRYIYLIVPYEHIL